LTVALSSGCSRTQTQTIEPHVLRFADGQDVQHLNTLLVTGYPELYPAQLTAAYHTRRDARNQPSPELAREIPTLANGGISADGKTIVFHLRPGLRWSDGAPLTARDVVFTTKLITGKDSPVADTSGWDQIASVDSPKPGDVRFRMKTSYGPAIGRFFNTDNGYSILPEHLLATTTDIRNAPFNDLPAGAGPFRYAAFKRGDEIVMEPNPYYFRGKPKLTRIVYKFLPDENTLATQIITGEIDLAVRVPATELPRLRAAQNITFVRTPSGNAGYIGFNVAKPPLDDLRVRQALHLALDRETILAKIYNGAGSVSDDVATPIDPFLGEIIPAQPRDVKRAEALLDAAGWHSDATGVRRRGGKPLAIELVLLTGNHIASEIVELVRAQWATIGVRLEVRAVDPSVVFEMGGLASKGDFGALVFGTSLTGETLASTFACSAMPPHGYNYMRACSASLDDLIRRADTSFDPALRTRLYLEARRRIAADSSFIPTIHREDDHALRPGVTGFHPNGNTLFDDAMDLDVN